MMLEQLQIPFMTVSALLGISVCMNVFQCYLIFRQSDDASDKAHSLAELAVLTRKADNSIEATNAVAQLEYNRAALNAQQERAPKQKKEQTLGPTIRDQATGKEYDVLI